MLPGVIRRCYRKASKSRAVSFHNKKSTCV